MYVCTCNEIYMEHPNDSKSHDSKIHEKSMVNYMVIYMDG